MRVVCEIVCACGAWDCVGYYVRAVCIAPITHTHSRTAEQPLTASASCPPVQLATGEELEGWRRPGGAWRINTGRTQTPHRRKREEGTTERVSLPALHDTCRRWYCAHAYLLAGRSKHPFVRLRLCYLCGCATLINQISTEAVMWLLFCGCARVTIPLIFSVSPCSNSNTTVMRM